MLTPRDNPKPITSAYIITRDNHSVGIGVFGDGVEIVVRDGDFSTTCVIRSPEDLEYFVLAAAALVPKLREIEAERVSRTNRAKGNG